MTYESFNLDELISPDPSDSVLVPWQEIYPGLTRKPLRLSFSSFNLAHSCPRKFHLLKNKDLSEYNLDMDTRKNNVHLDFGSAMGLGIQSYILSQDVEKSIFTALSSYNFAFETDSKNSLSIVTAIISFASVWLADEWEIVYYKGKPAAELSFKLILDEATQDYYCGFIDVVIRHKIDKIAVIVEVKSTGSKLQDVSPMYRNSAQGVGYSIVLDAIEQQVGFDASWTVLYTVVQYTSNNIIPKIHLLPFKKQAKDRFEWLLTTKLDYQQLLTYMELSYWPKRGGSCLAYNRACTLYGLCDLEQMAERDEAKITPEIEWDFTFKLEELIEKEFANLGQ